MPRTSLTARVARAKLLQAPSKQSSAVCSWQVTGDRDFNHAMRSF